MERGRSVHPFCDGKPVTKLPAQKKELTWKKWSAGIGESNKPIKKQREGDSPPGT